MATEEKTLDNETAGPPKIIQYACRKMGVIFRIQSVNNGTIMDMKKVWYKYIDIEYENEYEYVYNDKLHAFIKTCKLYYGHYLHDWDVE